MKLFYFFVLALLISCNSNNDFKIKKIIEFNSLYKNNKCEFPLLEGNKEIAKKINKTIIFDLLDLDIDNTHQSIFENVWATKENKIPRLSFLDYDINVLNDLLYAVTFNTEGCGAYCEEFSVSYNFDISNGNIIELNSIFTELGKKKFIQVLNNRKETTLRNTINKLEKEKLIIKEENDFTDRINLLKECLENSKISSFEFLDFKIENELVTIYSDRCSNHAMRALDEIGEFKFIFKTKELNEYLNKYGKRILTTKN